jgi:hypothetical protein
MSLHDAIIQVLLIVLPAAVLALIHHTSRELD